MVLTKHFINKLRSSSLRPTRQRVKICKILFDREKTFHFSILRLAEIIKNQKNDKISLATIYNTVHALTKKGYLKEISINANQSYFDTNTTDHHHFFDEANNKIVDLSKDDISSIEIKKKVPGKKIKSVEILVRLVDEK